MGNIYFQVDKYPDEKNPTDIAFIPVNDEVIPKEYLRFKSDIEAFVSTIKILFKDDNIVKSKFYDDAFFAAKICFSGNKNDFMTATQTLGEIKNELKSSYWATVRNKILKKYGAAVLVTSLILAVIGYFVNSNYQFYLISLVGTCLGSWLSVAIRTKDFVFEDIAQHMSEVSSPYIRCAFVCILSFASLLLLVSGLLEVKIGGISSHQIKEDVDIALAIGVIFGFGEKYLISSIRKRSGEFVE